MKHAGLAREQQEAVTTPPAAVAWQARFIVAVFIRAQIIIAKFIGTTFIRTIIVRIGLIRTGHGREHAARRVASVLPRPRSPTRLPGPGSHFLQIIIIIIIIIVIIIVIISINH